MRIIFRSNNYTPDRSPEATITPPKTSRIESNKSSIDHPSPTKSGTVHGLPKRAVSVKKMRNNTRFQDTQSNSNQQTIQKAELTHSSPLNQPIGHRRMLVPAVYKKTKIR